MMGGRAANHKNAQAWSPRSRGCAKGTARIGTFADATALRLKSCSIAPKAAGTLDALKMVDSRDLTGKTLMHRKQPARFSRAHDGWLTIVNRISLGGASNARIRNEGW
jgi:hypothetical protein